MKAKQARLSDGSMKITATTTGLELRQALDYAYRAFAQGIGLAPAPDQSIEDAAKEQLGISDLSRQIQPYLEERLVSLAIDKANVMPAFMPTSVALSQPAAGVGIEMEFTVTPKPAYELSSYDPVEIAVVRPVVFEEDIEREMAAYAAVMANFDDPDKDEKLRGLVIQKLEDQNAQSFVSQQRQAVSIELAKRLEGDVPDEALRAKFAELLDDLKSQLRAQGTPFEDFLREHGGEENVNMLTMWQAREALRQGYALDALYRHEKLRVADADVTQACCVIFGLDDPRSAREAAGVMGKMHVAREAAQRFRAADWALERARITVRDQSPLEE